MFIRMKAIGKYRYLQLVKSRRAGRRVVQDVLCTLGRLEDLEASGTTDALLYSLARFSHRVTLTEVNDDRGPLQDGGSRLKSDFVPRRRYQPSHRAISPVLPPQSSAIAQAGEESGSNSTKAPQFPEHNERADILGKSSIFRGLDTEHLLELSRLTTECPLKAGDFLFFQGDLLKCLYVVAAGELKILNHSSSGKDFIIAFCGPGSVLGNTPLFSSKPHPSSLQAVTDAKVLAIRNADLVSFLSRHIELSSSILRRLLELTGERLLIATLRLNVLASEPADCRLARVLLILSLQFGGTIPITRREIAEMAGTTTETAVRFVSDLRQIGVVKPFRRKLLILEQSKLMWLAGGSLAR